MAAAQALGVLASWRGLDRLLYLFGSQASLDDYLGNRYSQQGLSSRVAAEVFERAPMSGYGLRGVGVATDSALVHAVVLAGLFGVAAVAVATFAPLMAWLHHRRGMPTPERLLFGGVALMVVLGSIGAPALVANRLSVLVWALLALLLARSPSPAASLDGWETPRSSADSYASSRGRH